MVNNILLNYNCEYHFDSQLEYQACVWNNCPSHYPDDEFFQFKLKNCFSLTHQIKANNILSEKNQFIDLQNDFSHLSNATFINFFRLANVDIPRCFKRTKNMRRSTNELELLKLSNYLMRHGKRAKTLKTLLTAIHESHSDYSKLFFNDYKDFFDWRKTFLTLNYLSFQSKNYTKFNPTLFEFDSYGHQITNISMRPNFKLHFSSVLTSNIYKMLPVFSFYIYKVDKKIFKNTRGKSGKFTFLWKYVSQFKRRFLVMHWLMKEMRIKPGRSLQDRVNNIIKTLVFTPKKTWMWKVKKFSHNYVYYNCRKSLAETYRTVKN